MQKNFDEWNEVKKKINKLDINRFYHEREIWWAKIGLNIGNEQNGNENDYERPVLIIKEFGKNICLIIPMTTSPQKHKYRFNIGLIKQRTASVIISQMRVIGTKRLINKIQTLDRKNFIQIRKNIRDLF
ncbi:MAG TPA: type II toxin-antitoxin system PemK/MazF family toxin [Candidatus Paceibacterota bacterium]|nr:type II toxin-antitoxin system PemK/MazF family toxin [Candidatus Paceibacterota bacterium]